MGFPLFAQPKNDDQPLGSSGSSQSGTIRPSTLSEARGNPRKPPINKRETVQGRSLFRAVKRMLTV